MSGTRQGLSRPSQKQSDGKSTDVPLFYFFFYYFLLSFFFFFFAPVVRAIACKAAIRAFNLHALFLLTNG